MWPQAFPHPPSCRGCTLAAEGISPQPTCLPGLYICLTTQSLSDPPAAYSWTMKKVPSPAGGAPPSPPLPRSCCAAPGSDPPQPMNSTMFLRAWVREQVWAMQAFERRSAALAQPLAGAGRAARVPAPSRPVLPVCAGR